jgi:hypothetical protein
MRKKYHLPISGILANIVPKRLVLSIKATRFFDVVS